MKTARIFLVVTATLQMVGCGGNTGIRQGEPAPQACNEPTVCSPEPEPEPWEGSQWRSLAPYEYPLVEPPELAVLPRCSPIPRGIERYGGGCTLSDRNTVCQHLEGPVYLWNPSKNCKKPGVRNSAEGDNDCFDTGIARGSHAQIALYPISGAYCRAKSGGWIEILTLSKDVRRISEMNRLGWLAYSHSLCCPEGRECLPNTSTLDRAPDCR